MQALSWNHNAPYHPLLLRQLPARCERVLDLGCGAGGFAVRLAQRAEQVDALDRSPAMIDAARRVVPANVTCLEADILDPAGGAGALRRDHEHQHPAPPAVARGPAGAGRWCSAVVAA